MEGIFVPMRTWHLFGAKNGPQGRKGWETPTYRIEMGDAEW